MRRNREGGGGEVQPDEPSSVCLLCKPADRPSNPPSTPRPYRREKIKGKVQEYMCILHRNVSWNGTDALCTRMALTTEAARGGAGDKGTSLVEEKQHE